MSEGNEGVFLRSLDDNSAEVILVSLNNPAREILLPQGQTESQTVKAGQQNNPEQYAVITTYRDSFQPYGGTIQQTPEQQITPERIITIVDYSEAPQLQVIDLSKYNGEPGGLIRIRIIGGFNAKEVWIGITGKSGEASESGLATAVDIGQEWVYMTKLCISFMSFRTIFVKFKS